MGWKFNQIQKKLPKLNNPIFIEGLPGIGNVGKIAADFMREELKAKKIYDIFSFTFPHSVFVNDKNLVELPAIDIHAVSFNDPKKNDFILLLGDVQPIDEVSCYEFCEAILDLCERFNCKEIITLGGIGLSAVPKLPKVYITGNDTGLISDYCKSTGVSNELYGIVGPIVGVSGLLVGLAQKRKLPAIALLAETYGHPMFLGIKGAKEIMLILDKRFSLNINMEKLEKEIKSLESETVRKAGDFNQISQRTALKKLSQKIGKEVDYIG